MRHPDVDKVAFTGSHRRRPQDRRHLRRAAQAGAPSSSAASRPPSSSTTPTSTPPSRSLMPAALMNNGQACVAQTRILAPPRPLRRGARRARPRPSANFKVGDPLDPDHRDRPAGGRAPAGAGRGLHRRRPGRRRHASSSAAGVPPASTRAGTCEPTVFADVDNSMTIAQEEIFGPVLSLIPYDDDDDAVRIANDSRLRPGRLGVDRRRRAAASTSPAGCAPAPTA